MPNCFTLTPKGATEPEALQSIDEKLCKLLGEEVHPRLYVHLWVDVEGLALACGKDWAWMREHFDAERKPIIDFLEANYTPDAWAEVGGRKNWEYGH